MTIFNDTAMRFREAGDLDQFREWAALAIEAAKALAPYQSPRLTAVAIGAPTVTKIEITGGMSDDEFAVEQTQLPAQILPGMVIEADPNGDADPDDIAEPTGPTAA